MRSEYERKSAQVQDDTTARRLAIIGALKLYPDIINQFVLRLQVFGNCDEEAGIL